MKAILAVCITLLSLCVFGESAPERKLLPAGTAAPGFSLPSLSGDRVSLSMYCGKTLSRPYLNKVRHTVIVSFWATYCRPCHQEIPELQTFADKHKNDNVVILCVSIDEEGADIVNPFVKEKGYTMQVLLDPYTKTAERYGVKSLPALFVIDTMGIIRFASHGYDAKNPLGPKLEKILKGIREGTKISLADEGRRFVSPDIIVPGNPKAGSDETSKPLQPSPKQR
jgi:cytochrome c biogenesis protein CcmG, thiol:disulfide interchange protein DsbE